MQYFYPEDQFIISLYFALVGVLLSLLYDIFKIKREFFGQNSLVLFFDDLVYMLVCSVVFVVCILKINSGNVRWFQILFSIVGFSLYRLTISRLVITVFFFISRLLKSFVRRSVTIFLKILSPFLLPFKKIYCIIKKWVTQAYINFIIYKYKIIMIKKIKAVSR